MTRAYAVTVGRPAPEDLPSGPARIVETGRVALALYQQAGLLIVHSRHPRTGGVVLDLSDLDDAALELLRVFAGER